MKKSHIAVAEYLNQQIALSGVPQTEIAEKLGYDKPNIITMFKQGKTKIPMNKIAPLAKVLGIDPVHLLRMAMLEYSPETWEVLESLLGHRMIPENEQRVLALMHSATGGRDIAPKNDDQERQLAELFGQWASAEDSFAQAAIHASTKRRKPSEAPAKE